jgi:HPt (histidine-containing phosphotransfer) domain-containing protein
MMEMIKKKESQINLEHLYDLASGDKDFIREMIEYYLGQTPVVMKELRQYQAQKEWNELGELAHKAKSSFKFMGIQELTEHAKTLEEICREQPKESQIDHLLKSIQTLVNSSSEELRKELDKLD